MDNNWSRIGLIDLKFFVDVEFVYLLYKLFGWKLWVHKFQKYLKLKLF